MEWLDPRSGMPVQGRGFLVVWSLVEVIVGLLHITSGNFPCCSSVLGR